MNKRRLVSIGLILVMGIGTYNTYKTATLIKQNTVQQEQIRTLETENEKIKSDYQKLLEEGKKHYDENQKLKQELENIQALKAKQQRSLVASRGAVFKHVTYNVDSRVDVETGISAAQLDKAFAGTKMEGLGSAFVKAEQETGISAIFLSSIAILESGWGESEFARKRNNLFGFGSYDGVEHNTVRFKSKEEGVLHVARYLAKHYLTSDGKYYNGATPKGVNVKYCSSSSWSNKITNIMNTIVNRATR